MDSTYSYIVELCEIFEYISRKEYNMKKKYQNE